MESDERYRAIKLVIIKYWGYLSISFNSNKFGNFTRLFPVLQNLLIFQNRFVEPREIALRNKNRCWYLWKVQCWHSKDVNWKIQLVVVYCYLAVVSKGTEILIETHRKMEMFTCLHTKDSAQVQENWLYSLKYPFFN